MEQLKLEGLEPGSARTGWFYGPPPCTGWWETRRADEEAPAPSVRRYYHLDPDTFKGEWSMGVVVGTFDEEETLEAQATAARRQDGIMYRGLVEPAPEYVTPLVLVPPYGRMP